MKYTVFFFYLLSSTPIWSQNNSINKKDLFSYFDKQARATVKENPGINKLPVVIDSSKIAWTNNDIYNWRSGFWPGIEWYLYEATKDNYWKVQAEKSTEMIAGVIDKPVYSHDLGFQFYCSYGNGYRLTKNEAYKAIMLRAADSLATLFNPKVGTILSWPYRVKQNGWQHHTIIDNMMNLELLFWAAKNGGNKKLYDIAFKHAEVTMNNHFRADFSTYHVVFYDSITGAFIKGATHQGYNDNSVWARGQAWAIYGFTMAYRETKHTPFLQIAIKAADLYLKKLSKDKIPYWDFNDPPIPNAPKDASASAITASALLELSDFISDKVQANKYKNAAKGMIKELSTDQYLSKETNHAFLLHSTGNKPALKDVDVPIIYADYYFLEALLRWKK